jgi:hypothetical protein
VRNTAGGKDRYVYFTAPTGTDDGDGSKREYAGAAVFTTGIQVVTSYTKWTFVSIEHNVTFLLFSYLVIGNRGIGPTSDSVKTIRKICFFIHKISNCVIATRGATNQMEYEYG